jgi:hypothetical protein
LPTIISKHLKKGNKIMKIVHLIVFIISLNTIHYLFAAPRTHTRGNESSQQVVYVPVPVSQNYKTSSSQLDTLDPIERDKIIDNQLFAHFMSILGNFGKVMLNPHDKENVTSHVAQMIDGIVAVAHTVTKVKRSPQNFRRLVELFMQHLKYQRTQQKIALH